MVRDIRATLLECAIPGAEVVVAKTVRDAISVARQLLGYAGVRGIPVTARIASNRGAPTFGMVRRQ